MSDSNALENKALSLGKLLVPKGYNQRRPCDHKEVDQKRHGAKCKACGAEVYLMVTETRYMTLAEQRTFRYAQKGIHLPGGA